MNSHSFYNIFLQQFTKSQLAEGYHLLSGFRFKSNLRKQYMVDAIEVYVRNHSAEILAKLDAQSLLLIKRLLDAGKGALISVDFIGGTISQAEQMLLVGCHQTIFEDNYFMADELYDYFSSDIGDAYSEPSDALSADLAKGFERMAERLKSAEDPEQEQRLMMFEILTIGLMGQVEEIGYKLQRDDVEREVLQRDYEFLKSMIQDVKRAYQEAGHQEFMDPDDYESLLMVAETLVAGLKNKL